jgi:hypothetical protein
MAIGDAVAVFLGTGASVRQPSSGVEEQLSAIAKQGTTDPIYMYDGTNQVRTSDGGIVTDRDIVDGVQAGASPYNSAIMITNSLYIQKTGTTDRFYFGGVQTNA